jgi:ATPase inhibitor, mitochondrial
MNTLRLARLGQAATHLAPTTTLRSFSIVAKRMAEGDTGALRARGQQSADTWTRREKAAEDMYIKEREKTIMMLLREKIAKQEEQLAKDMAMLAAMEDQYGQDAAQRGV